MAKAAIHALGLVGTPLRGRPRSAMAIRLRSATRSPASSVVSRSRTAARPRSSFSRLKCSRSNRSTEVVAPRRIDGHIIAMPQTRPMTAIPFAYVGSASYLRLSCGRLRFVDGGSRRPGSRSRRGAAASHASHASAVQESAHAHERVDRRGCGSIRDFFGCGHWYRDVLSMRRL
jgi:hypothetical protein